jgi:hypothetical protein
VFSYHGKLFVDRQFEKKLLQYTKITFPVQKQLALDVSSYEEIPAKKTAV